MQVKLNMNARRFVVWVIALAVVTVANWSECIDFLIYSIER